MTVRSAVVTTHRWMGLIASVLWLLQAVTGVVAVFHWEIDDAITAGAHRPTDLKAIEQRVRAFAPHSIWTTAGVADRYDVFADGRVIRIDGAGNVLRIRRDDEKFAHGGFVDTLVVLHQSLLAGDRGRWIIGASGLLLSSNLMLGIIAAWPRRGQWKRALKPLTMGSRVASLYSWHRALGLWLAALGLCVAGAGVLLAFEEATERLLHPASVEPAAQPSTAAVRVGMAQATESALARYRGSVVSGIGFPTPANAMWTITLKLDEEQERAYGNTRVFVSAMDGRIVADFDARTASPARRLLNNLFAFHTGQIIGMPGRILVIITGIWLIAMIALGLALWWTRRSKALSLLISSSARPDNPRPSSGR